ncbi:stomatin-like protein 3 [Sinocyclocheilus grahami]|uniref:stomatin-like protein 3 n=1 Tax=Sinocyclocheilus grahami TaxID=75366 RepID=UPI0007ACEC20|nr:PREDICTED: stomatin-like protein 3 [Sinocyclocheilus grahami]
MEMESEMERGAQSKQNLISENNSGLGCCGWILVIISAFFSILIFPISIFITIKIVKEYERAVIFRLGRITARKAKGPGNT